MAKTWTVPASTVFSAGGFSEFGEILWIMVRQSRLINTGVPKRG